MSIAQSARIHPTAIVAPEASIGEDVEIGSYVVIEGTVTLGARCVVRPAAVLIGPMTIGEGNQIFSHAVLGERPQHLKYAGEPTTVQIGNYNIFREGVTVHRGTTATCTTRIGDHNFLMANAHVAHDCVVGNNCLLANGALIGGHCLVEDNVFLSGNAALHQFVRAGRLSLLSGCSGTTKDIPPFIIVQRINAVGGINVIGMRRAGIPSANIDAVRRAFHLLYHEGLAVPEALTRIDAEVGTVPEVMELTRFIRASSRGISLSCDRAAA
jgi:UDP-N-acetylglucosamine acyltransferase